MSIQISLAPTQEGFIRRPIVPDGLTGYDQFGQLATCVRDEGEGEDRYQSYSHIRDVRGCICYICKKGWENTTKSLQDQHTIDSGAKVVHETCYVGFIGLKEYYFWRDVIYDCRTREMQVPFDIKETPNEYGGAWKTPWYEIELLSMGEKSERPPLGVTIKVGTRKRVYHMEVNGLKDNPFAYFENEDSTKGWSGNADDGFRYYIHAWTDADAKRYMNIFLKSAYGIEILPHEFKQKKD